MPGVVLFIALVFSLPYAAHAATASECAFLKKAGVSQCNEQTPFDKNLYGGCDTDPYEPLLARYTPGPNSKTEGDNGIMKLNPDFACRLSKFMEAAGGSCSMTIVSAYRSPGIQAKLFEEAVAKHGSTAAARQWVAAPPCSAQTGASACGNGSRHNFGMAADISFAGSKKPLTQGCIAAARNASTYKIGFPLGHEPWHAEPTGSVRGGAGAGSGDSGDGPAPSYAPSSSLTDAIRTWSSGTQQDTECAQLEKQCTQGGHAACMAYASRCKAGGGTSQAPSPHAPTAASAPTSGGTSQAVSGAYQPPALYVPPALSPATDTPALPPLASSTNELPSITVGSTSVAHGLSSSTIIELVSQQVRIESRPVPPTVVSVPVETGDISIVPSTFDTSALEEAIELDEPNPFLPTSLVRTRTFESLRADLAQARAYLEYMLLLASPFSSLRYDTH